MLKTSRKYGSFLGRGSLIGVEGKFKLEIIKGKDGNLIYVEVVADRINSLNLNSSNKQNNG